MLHPARGRETCRTGTSPGVESRKGLDSTGAAATKITPFLDQILPPPCPITVHPTSPTDLPRSERQSKTVTKHRAVGALTVQASHTLGPFWELCCKSLMAELAFLGTSISQDGPLMT